MTRSEFFQKVSIKQTGPSPEKMDRTVLFQGRHGQFLVSIKQPGLDIWKNLYQMSNTIFFSNSRNLERPGLVIETLEYLDC